MNVTIEDGENYKIVGSGTVFSFRQEPIKIKIATGESELDLEFKFEKGSNDSDKPTARAEVEGTTLKIRLFNYDNLLGSGTKQPLRLGFIGKEDIYINFRVYGGGDTDSDKLLHFTIYMVPTDETAETQS